jgi:hypothetical protein
VGEIAAMPFCSAAAIYQLLIGSVIVAKVEGSLLLTPIVRRSRLAIELLSSLHTTLEEVP